MNPLRSVEHGPRLLFFSGGTALRTLSRELIRHTHNSVHIITPLDSGGSSAVLRKAFAMPAVGDIRNRLMALADLTEAGTQEIFALFTYRLSKREPQEALVGELERLADGEHVLISLIPQPQRAVIQLSIRYFLDQMPDDFDLHGASIGNLILTADYLSHDRELPPVIDHFSEVARVRGVVRPVVDEDLHLAARLADGSTVVGQHLLTGKEASPLTQKIEHVWMTDSLDSAEPVSVQISDEVRQHIVDADLICFPVGSFYSSVIANLLPDGVGEAVAANSCSKVFVPNPVGDPELLGHTVVEQVELLRQYLISGTSLRREQVLDTILVDSQSQYPGGLDVEALEALDLNVVDQPLVSLESAPFFASKQFTEALISLAD